MEPNNTIIEVEPITDSSQWTINLDNPEIRILRANHPEINEDQFDTVVQTAAEILKKCPSPNQSTGICTGLAIGKVQSGKTLSFTALIALAANSGYKIIVVLGGTTNQLLNQTRDRLVVDFGINSTDSTTNLYLVTNPTLRKNTADINNMLSNGRCIIILCLKQHRRLSSLTKLLKEPEFSDKPTLIIDDEADAASLNNASATGERSTTNQRIHELRSALKLHAWISYTATPQANLLQQDIEFLSPDFCQLVDPGPEYCGGSVFFGTDMRKYVNTFSDEAFWADYTTGIPESLRDAIAVFFISAAVRHIRKERQKHSMMIHTSELVDLHFLLRQNIVNLLNGWRDRLLSTDQDPGKQDILNIMKRAYDELCRTIFNPPSWNVVIEKLFYELSMYKVYVVNSGRDADRETDPQFENHIYVGGNILGRGLTIKNLTISYMSRRAITTTAADTMEQRARWFGYKLEYLDLCRIYLTRQLTEDFQNLLAHEDDFWDSLKMHIRIGSDIRRWPRLFLLEGDINPTRAAVARWHTFAPTGWTTQRRPSLNSDDCQHNLQVLNAFLNNKTQIVRPDGHTHLGDLTVDEIILNLFAQISYKNSDWETPYIRAYLSKLMASNRLEKISVLLMGRGDLSGGFRKRGLTDGAINPFGGRSTNLEPSDPGYYPGDEKIPDGRPQLQIHRVGIHERNEDEIKYHTCVLELYIPELPQYDLRRYLVRSEE